TSEELARDYLNSLDDLFNTDYHQKLNDTVLTLDSYEVIIQNIIEIGENKLIYRKNMTPLERVIAIAQAYSIVITKELGNSYGEYAYNVICIDRSFDSSIQIATVIHELTHHLFNEILKHILIYIWNVKKSPLMDAFVQTLASLPPVLLASEYCASKSEEYYLPEEYVSFSSFNQICEDLEFDEKVLL
ncbi:MAG: zinc ribbon domain-containing protein, partial [Methanosphaera sp.]|nr:zinc ribbon domain-containing protein [Methanosphaera sp.]